MANRYFACYQFTDSLIMFSSEHSYPSVDAAMPELRRATEMALAGKEELSACREALRNGHEFKGKTIWARVEMLKPLQREDLDLWHGVYKAQ